MGTCSRTRTYFDLATRAACTALVGALAGCTPEPTRPQGSTGGSTGQTGGAPATSTGGTGGTVNGTGGMTSSGTGGARAGTGGSTAGTGGAAGAQGPTGGSTTVGTGGMGGASTATGGSGGRAGGTGGVVPDAGVSPDASSAVPDAAPPRPSTDGGNQPKIAAGVAKIFDVTKLHQIAITVPQQHVATLGTNADSYVPVTFTFDGTTLTNVGMRQSGGGIQSYRALFDKPSFTVKFDAFTPTQELFGIEKINLKNGYQDLSFVNEHMTYEVFRRAGVPARETAHAAVTINGTSMGFYILREAINKQHLTRIFGSNDNDGNLYEGAFGNDDITRIELKDEMEEMRTRDDIRALDEAIKGSDAAFPAAAEKILDLNWYITASAVTTLTTYYDSFDFNLNNYYFYNRQADGRFVILPHGADQAFMAIDARTWSNFRSGWGEEGIYIVPDSALATKVRKNATFDQRYRAEMMRIMSPQVWDKQALLARVAQVGTIFNTANKADAKIAADIARFDKYRPTVETFINYVGLSGGYARFSYLGMQ